MNEKCVVNKRKPYSYHTFMYPFRWAKRESSNYMTELSRDEFEKVLCDNNWQKYDMITADNRLRSVEKNEDILQQRLDYQAYQYFNSATRKALFRGDGQIVHNFVYDRERVHNKAKYIITAKEKKYELAIENIHLKLFNTGVGILILETEYYGDVPKTVTGNQENVKKSLTEIKRQSVRAINEYGRRLFPEFLPKKLYDSSLEKSTEKIDEETRKKILEERDGTFIYSNLCASNIEIQIGDIVLKEDIQKKAEAYLKQNRKLESLYSYLDDPGQPSTIITKLLLGVGNEKEDFVKTVSGKESKRDKHKRKLRYTIELIPAIDDRMFVCCCIRDSEWGKHFVEGRSIQNEKNNSEEKQQKNPQRDPQKDLWSFLSDFEIGKELYGLLNIDAGDSSCQNRKMLNQYFEEQLYLRWVEYGTFHAVTNHSMICLTGENVEDSVVNPFLILYTQMCSLVLAQRASLIAFDSDISQSITEKNDNQCDEETRRWFNRAVIEPNKRRYEKRRSGEQLIKLEKNFTRFQGELLLAEVTPQIQGIELYEKMQKMLFIDKLHDNVQVQIHNLFEIAENEQQAEDSGMEKALSALAILTFASFLVDFYDFFDKVFTNGESVSCILWIVSIVILLILLFGTGMAKAMMRGIIYVIYSFYRKHLCRRRRKGDKHEQ